ncbi:MAG: TetR/AcrR family transcriptional regulator [Promethearchaeota archaeon]
MNDQRNNNSEELTKKDIKMMRTRKIIIEAAKSLFSKKSFDMITMEEIADLAALSRATLYNYFKTKEEIYFNIGISKLKEWIEQNQLLNSNNYSGKEYILLLTENLVEDLLEFPVYSRLLRRFFYRSDELNIPIEKIFYEKLIEKKRSSNSIKIKTLDKVFLDLLNYYIDYRLLWQKNIETGLKDGSIRTASNPSHLNFIIIMIIFGLLDQIDFRRTLMDLVELSNEQIKSFILNLIKKFLEGEI